MIEYGHRRALEEAVKRGRQAAVSNDAEGHLLLEDKLRLFLVSKWQQE